MANQDFTIKKGKTLELPYRWGLKRLVYKSISAVTKAAPCVLHVPAHGIPEGWLFRVVAAAGMDELNPDSQGLLANGQAHYQAALVDADHIEINDVVSTDFGTYTGGGSIEYREPVDLTDYTARMMVRDDPDDEDPLLELTTENGGIVIDNTLKQVILTMSETDTAAINWETGIYDLELVSPGDVVSELASGRITVFEEVTKG